MDRYDIEYDPRQLEEYMRAGRKERALAFGQMLNSIKELFTKTADEAKDQTSVNPHTVGAC